MPGPDIRLVGYGDQQGIPCLCIDAQQLDVTDEGCLVRHVSVQRPAGVRVVQLVGNVPWGSVELERAIVMFNADARTEGLDLWAMRSVSEDKWSAMSIWWCHDVSKLMDQPRTANQVIKLIQDLPYIVPATEVVAIKPDAKVLDATVLDEVHTRLDAGVGWLYVSDENLDLATREIAKAGTHWGVRRV